VADIFRQANPGVEKWASAGDPIGMTLEAPAGATIQLWVNDGPAARRWYQELFGREPAFRPFDDDTFCEWQFKPGYWEIHIVEQEPAGSQTARLRFGVEDIAAQREFLLGRAIAVSGIEELASVVKWCNFDDPWGNKLGLYQDLRVRG